MIPTSFSIACLRPPDAGEPGTTTNEDAVYALPSNRTERTIAGLRHLFTRVESNDDRVDADADQGSATELIRAAKSLRLCLSSLGRSAKRSGPTKPLHLQRGSPQAVSAITQGLENERVIERSEAPPAWRTWTATYLFQQRRSAAYALCAEFPADMFQYSMVD